MISKVFLIFILVIIQEGFYLLPEEFVVLIPGVFRISDSMFFVLPVFLLIYINNILGIFHRFREETMLILFACFLVFLSPLMAWLFFDQPYLTGLLLMRHNLVYLTFFLFIMLFKTNSSIENILKLLTMLFFVYTIIVIVTKYFPDLGLINFPKGTNIIMRFGETRLRFPYENIPILLYCFNLSSILYPRKGKNIFNKAVSLAFIFLLFYALLSTFTRIVVISLLFITVYALYTSKRRILQYMAISLTIIFISVQLLSMAVSQGGIPFIEESKLGKIVLQTGKLEPESGRMFQVSMYVNNFIKSPFLGVGNIASGKYDEERDNYMRSYRKYGIFNNTDIGYLKMAAENGLVGITWVVWFYSYIYRQSKQTLAKALALGDEPVAEAVARGLRYFLIYLAISGLTLPHFVVYNRIPALVLALAIMAVTHESLRLRTAAAIA